MLEDIVNLLKSKHKTISTMESCTGGAIANEITNIEGASEVIKFSAVTYANEFKIKMGVFKDTIEKYSVYSKEVAMEMSKNIVLYTDSDYGIGITGKLNKVDNFNKSGDDNKVFYSIYNKKRNQFFNYELIVPQGKRSDIKDYIVLDIKNKLLDILNKELL